MVKPKLFLRGHSHGVLGQCPCLAFYLGNPDTAPAPEWQKAGIALVYLANILPLLGSSGSSIHQSKVAWWNFPWCNTFQSPGFVTVKHTLWHNTWSDVGDFFWHTQETAGVCFRTLLVKLTGPYWFHYVSYRQREGNWVATCCNVCSERKAIS